MADSHDKYVPRRGTADVGIDYEIITSAYFAIRLYQNEEVDDFRVRLSDSRFGYFDDIIIDVRMKNGEEYYFAFQLTHRSRKIFRSKIDKFLQSFEKLDTDIKIKYNFVLYTNADRVTFENFTTNNDESHAGGFHLFDIKKVYRIGDQKDDFFSKFFIVTNQDIHEIKTKIDAILTYDEVSLRFINWVRNYWMRQSKKPALNQDIIGLRLVDMFLSVLSPYLVHIEMVDSKYKSLESVDKALSRFDVTVVDMPKTKMVDHPVYECIKHLVWTRTYHQINEYTSRHTIDSSEDVLEKCLFSLAKENHLVYKGGDDDTKQMLRYLFLKLVFLDFREDSSDMIYKMMEFYRIPKNDINFVLLGKNIETKPLSGLKILKNLNDIRDEDNKIYSHIAGESRVSLQGRELPLEKFLSFDPNIAIATEVLELLQMTTRTYPIGEEKEILPLHYISRTVTTPLFDLESIVDHFQKTASEDQEIIIIEDEAKHTEQSKEYKYDKIDYMLIRDQTEESWKHFIKKENVHVFKKLDEGLLPLFSNPIQKLRTIESKKLSLSQDEIYCYFKRRLNIVCGSAGSGKTLLFRFLKNTASVEFWTVLVTIRNHSSFFKTEHQIEEILDHLLKSPDQEDSYVEKVKRIFVSCKKVIFFFDGLDEITVDCLEAVLSSIIQLASVGFHVWISSRPTWQKTMEEKLNVFAINLDDLDQNQQNQLLSKLLGKEDLVRTTEVVTGNPDIFVNPLNLFLFSQFLSETRPHPIVMFRRLIEAKFDISIGEELRLLSMEYVLEDLLEKYEIAACQTLFEDEIFAKFKLDLRRHRRFLNEIATSGDRLGIITNVNEEKKAIFAHLSFAEFFAAEFLANNFDKAAAIRDELFAEDHRNLMRMLNLTLAEHSPLHSALILEDYDKCKEYLDAEFSVYDKAKRNALHIVSFNFTKQPCLEYTTSESSYVITDGNLEALEEESDGNKEILEILLNKFEPVEKDELFGWSSLDYALACRSLYFFNAVLKKHPKLDCYSLLTKYYNDPTIAFLSACCGYPELFKMLIETIQDGRLFNTTDLNQNTLLHMAAKHGKTNMVKMLKKIDPNLRNIQGETALHCVIANGNLDTIKLLLDLDVDINAAEEQGKTPLHYAATQGNDIVVTLLLESGAHINVKDEQGRTPLHYAATQGNDIVVTLLLESGAHIDVKDKQARTPLHYAAMNGHGHTVTFLLVRKANINALDDNGETPLHHAARSGHSETARVLTKHGADVSIKNKDGKTASELLGETGYPELLSEDSAF